MFPQWHSRMSFSSPTLIPRCCITSTGQSWASWLDTTSNTSSSGTTWTSCSPAAPGSASARCHTRPDGAQPMARPLSSISLADPRPAPARRGTSTFGGRATSLLRGRRRFRTPCYPLCSRRAELAARGTADDPALLELHAVLELIPCWDVGGHQSSLRKPPAPGLAKQGLLCTGGRGGPDRPAACPFRQ